MRKRPPAERESTLAACIGWQRGYDAETLEPLGTLVPFIVGEYITLTPAEFEKHFGWKNDPTKARLLKQQP